MASLIFFNYINPYNNFMGNYMHIKKFLKINFPSALLLALLLFTSVNIAQEINYSIEEVHQRFDYRRLDQNNLPPIEKYSQPKEQVFPLGYGTDHLNKVTSGTGVWTELNPKVPRVTYIGLHFVNKDTGWACGQSGAVIKTMDGGSSWTVSDIPVNNLLLKTHSYNGQVVLVTGYDGIILRSNDDGETFEQVTSGVGNGYDLWGVQMINDTLGWVCGLNQTLLKTTDAGLSWQPINTGLNQHYWLLDFINEQYGMIACSGGKVLKTTNGGSNWIQIQAGDTRALYTIDIIDSLHIAAAGADGKNVYSSDGGTIWISNQDLPAFTATNCIDFVDADTGYSVQDVYDIRKTTNRGQTWSNPGGGGEWQIQLLEDGTGYSGGDGLNIFKRTNGLENWKKLFLNNNWSDLFFKNEMEGFFLSNDFIGGGLFNTEDGGVSLEMVQDAPRGNDLLFLDSLTGFIGSNLIYKTTDGGVTWYVPSGGQGGAERIFFINETVGWAVRSNVIYKTTDSGENWFIQLTIPSDNFSSIFFIDTLNGWATSRYIWQTTNGGQNWIERIDIPAFFGIDVYFPDLVTGWIADYIYLYKTTNSGLDWTIVPEVVDAKKFCFFPDPVHWIILGFDRYYLTNDQGTSWIEFTNDVPGGLSIFYAPTNNIGFAAGNGGLILRYEDTTYVPVELISFGGTVEGHDIVLSWVTASELNNQGFYIQKTNNSINWETIGFVNGRGNSTETNSYSFVDRIMTDLKIFYRLKQVDYNGSFTYSEIIELEIPVNNFSLSQNFPNPANPSTIISFALPEQTKVKIKLYSINGECVKEVFNEEKDKGIYNITINLDDLATGVYFYRMTTDKGFSNVKKLILLK
jgi:photosystem II stability/assembly factor-like uncharacterized protein